MRQSINYNLDRRDEANNRWWKALRELQDNYPEEYAKRVAACKGMLGIGTWAQVATMESWLKEIKAGEVRQSPETGG